MTWTSSPTLTLEIEGWDLTAMAEGSIANAKSKGESGHPCRVPLDRGNGLLNGSFYVGLQGENAIQHGQKLSLCPVRWPILDCSSI